MFSVREALLAENTLESKNLWESYKVGGLQLMNYLMIASDYINELDARYPGIKEELYTAAER